MILQPVLHPILLALLLVPALGVVVWMLVRSRSAAARTLWVVRVLLVLACAALLLRPGIPGGSTLTLATDTDVVIVVDTTSSIVAEDWGDGERRLDGVRADVDALVDAYPGARFALITFDASAQLRLPLTTDATALTTSMSVLQPEVTAQSRGSSIGIAHDLLAETLAGAAELSPERARLVFYFGDGEQTASGEPESFAASAPYVVGGAVFGYGTSSGGPMRLTTGGLDASREYIQLDGERALSVIDEAALETIAGQLGVPYQHRTADTPPDFPPAPTTTTAYDDARTVGSIIDLSWIVALVVAVLLAFELARATMLVTRMRTLSVRTPRDEDGAA